MHLHVIQHVPFEGPGFILDWAEMKRHRVTATHLFDDEPFPDDNPDMLVIMGGPMSVGDNEPWMKREIDYLGQMVEDNVPMLGICLGAQLLAHVLGADTRKSPEKEIGWHPVTFTDESVGVPLLSGFPITLTPFHWHGDMFTIPESAVRIAESEGCPNQGFFAKGTILGLQFHLEATMKGIDDMLRLCANDLTRGPFVQKPEAILAAEHLADESNMLMARLLDNFAALVYSG